MNTRWRDRAQAILAPLPDRDGGIVVIMATAASPPALAVLSSGDVLITDNRVRVGVFATSSSATRLDGGFSLLVPAGAACLRVEAVEATAETHGGLALVEGRLHDVRPTSEPPWVVDMAFRPGQSATAAIHDHVRYWADVRQWLLGERSSPPTVPA